MNYSIRSMEGVSDISLIAMQWINPSKIWSRREIACSWQCFYVSFVCNLQAVFFKWAIIGISRTINPTTNFKRGLSLIFLRELQYVFKLTLSNITPNFNLNIKLYSLFIHYLKNSLSPDCLKLKKTSTFFTYMY